MGTTLRNATEPGKGPGIMSLILYFMIFGKTILGMSLDGQIPMSGFRGNKCDC